MNNTAIETDNFGTIYNHISNLRNIIYIKVEDDVMGKLLYHPELIRDFLNEVNITEKFKEMVIYM